jgi:histidyl-tRNA synthetase
MSEQKEFRAIKGTRDILPPDSALWEWFERTAREVFEGYGFGEIRTPIFEETSLFARSIGVETDVVSKEMYTFEDYDTSDEFFGLWSAATAKKDPKTDDELIEYARLYGEIVVAAERAIEKRILPKSPENVRALDSIRVLTGKLAGLSKDGPRETSAVVAGMRSATAEFDFGDSLTLRPEATAGICRAYIEHGMHVRPGNVKLYCMGPMFRRERPQKGRYRQFYQVDAEVLGASDAPGIDAEVIEMLLELLRRVGLTRTKLYLNSIGDKNCRPAYVELLREKLRAVKDQLGVDSRRRIETNPLRVLDSKIPEEQEIIATLPRISEHLCEACREHFGKLKDELRLRGIEYEENWRLVRGLDYYTRTTFEVTAEGLGSQNAVCGGGRYDGLVEMLGGPPTKGIGFAIGTDRAILSIEESGAAPKLPGLAVYVAWMGQAAYPAAVAIARKLREAGLAVELPVEEMKFKKSLGLADKLGARYALILGEDEVASKTYTLKRLADAEQMKLGEAELLEYLESERRGTRA